MRTIADTVVYALTGFIILYTIGWIIAIIGDRPAVVKRSDTGQWTAARSYNGERHWRKRSKR